MKPIVVKPPINALLQSDSKLRIASETLFLGNEHSYGTQGLAFSNDANIALMGMMGLLISRSSIARLVAFFLFKTASAQSIPVQRKPINAAKSSRLDQGQVLLKRENSESNQAFEKDRKDFYKAALNGKENSVKEFLDKGIDPNLRLKKDGTTALMIAAEKGHVEVVKTLLAHEGINLNIASTIDGGTALMIAAQKGHKDIIEALLDAGANPFLKDHLGRIAIDVATIKSYPEVIRLLKGVEEQNQYLDRAVLDNNTEGVKQALAEGAKPNIASTVDGATALHVATIKGHVEVVKALLAHEGIKPNIASSVDGTTALHLAAQEGHKDIIEALLDVGANPFLKDSHGRKASDHAKNRGYFEIVKRLEQKESDIERKLCLDTPSDYSGLFCMLFTGLALASVPVFYFFNKSGSALPEPQQAPEALPEPQANEEAPNEYKCPISLELMQDPVVTADGHTYERKEIEKWLRTSSLSPSTGMVLAHQQLVPNHALRLTIQRWIQQNPQSIEANQ